MNLSEKIGGSITIKDVRFGEDGFGTHADLTLGDGKKYRTWSKVVIGQLHDRIIKIVDDGGTAIARLSERKSIRGRRKYYSLWEIRKLAEEWQ